MPACKLMTRAAAGIPGSHAWSPRWPATAPTSASRSRGTGDQWFTGPAHTPDGLYLGAATAPTTPTPTSATRRSPRRRASAGWRWRPRRRSSGSSAARCRTRWPTTRRMYDITVGENPAFAHPDPGVPRSADRDRRDRGGAHRACCRRSTPGWPAGSPAPARSGAGLVTPPMECFTAGARTRSPTARTAAQSLSAGRPALPVRRARAPRGPGLAPGSRRSPGWPSPETVVPSLRSSTAHGPPGRSETADHLVPVEGARAVAVDDRQPVRRGRRAGSGPARRPRRPGDRRRPITVARSQPRELPRGSSGGSANQVTTTHGEQHPAEDDHRDPHAQGAERAGGSVGGRWLGSEPAGMDVGDQDAAGAELVELVHDPLRSVARHHRRAPRPSPRGAAGRPSGSRCPG